MKALRVLHLEDVENDAILVQHALRKGGFDPVVRVECTLSGFQAALESAPWDVVLADCGLPGFTESDAFQVYSRLGIDCPFILVSGHIGEDQAAEAMRQGVHDYVLKDHLARLVPAVERAMEDARLRREARRMQQELVQHANDLRLFVEHAPAAIAMLDADMRYVAASGRWLADFGFGGRDLRGLSHYEVFPEISDAWKEIHRRCLAGAVERNDEDRFVRADGSVQWIRWEIRPWYKAPGVVGGVFIFSEDISDRMRAKEDLQQNEWMLSRGQRLAQVGTFYRDFKSNRLTGSEEVYRILGPGSESILATHDSLAPFVHPDDLPAYRRTKDEVRGAGKALTHEFRIVQPDGTERQIRSIGETVRDASGAAVGAIRVIQDITELHRAMQDLQKEKWLLSQSQRLARVGTLYRDMQTGVAVASEQVRDILGLSKTAELNFADGLKPYIHPADLVVIENSRTRLWNSPVAVNDEFRIIRPDGAIRHLTSIAESIPDAAGKPAHTIRVIQDVTEQKQANARLREKEWMLTRAQTIGKFGTWIRNLDTKTLTWSDETYRIFGIDPRTSLDFDAYAQAIVPEDRNAFLAERERVTRSGGSFEMEFRIRRGDGAIRTVWHVAERVYPSGGRSSGIIGIVQDITERKAAEAALREKEWMLSRAQEAGQIGTWFWDAATERMTVSAQTYRILGVSPDAWDHTIEGYRALVHPDDRDAFELQRMRKRQDRDGRFADDYRILRPDGSVRFVSHVGEFSLDENGKLKGLLGILQDITDRKRIEEELRHKEWMLTSAQEAGNIGTWFLDLRTGARSASKHTYRICGIDPDNKPPGFEGFLSIMHPEDRDAFKEARRLLNEEGTAMSGEFRMVRPNGQVRDVFIVGNRLADESGHPSATIGLVQDITERKQAEAELRNSQRLLTTVFNAIPYPTVVKDKEQRYLMVNRAFGETFGVDPATVVGRHTLEVRNRPQEELQLVVAEDARILSGQEDALRSEQLATTRGGESRFLSVLKVPLRDGRGNIAGLVAVAHDLTERWLAERALQENQHLLRTVLDAVPHAISLRDAESRYVIVNKAWTDWVGYSQDQAVGMKVTDVTTRVAADNLLIQQQDEQAYEQRSNVEFQRTETTRDGTLRHLKDIRAPVIDGRGTVSGIVGISVDITAERQAEAELREKQTFLSRAQEVAHMGVWYRDSVSGSSRWSDQLYRILGVSPDAFVPTDDAIAGLVHPDDRPACSALRKEVDTSSGRFSHTCRVVRPDGEMRHVHIVGEAVFNEQGSPVALTGVVQDVTERVFADQELREKEWILTRAQEVAHLGSWYRDMQSGGMRWSDELYRIWGVDPATFEPTFDAMMSRIHPEDQARYITAQEKNLGEGARFTVDHRILWPSGEVRYLHLVGQTINDAAGNATAMIGITQDVTDRYQADQAMQEKDWILTRAQEVAQLGVWYRDLRTNLNQWSDELFRILGLDPQTTTPSAQTFLSLVHPADRDNYVAARDRMNADNSRMEEDFRFLRPNGEVRWMHVLAQTVLDEHQTPVAFIGIGQDITERKRVETELREKEWMLSHAQEVAHVGSFFRDRRSGVLKWSHELFRICGVDPATFTPTVESYVELVHPEDRPAFFINRQRAFAEGAQIVEESRLVRPDGKVRNVILMAEQVNDGSGEPAGLMGIVQDITDRKINEGRLVQAQKLEAMGRLTAGVAHDFNNLLTIISGNLELMGRDIGENQLIRPMLDTVLKATNRGADLIRQMSAFNRKRPLKQRVMSPREAIESMARLVPRTLGETIQVHTTVSPEIWDIQADPAQLESALVNMAINARDAMPTGGRLVLTAGNVTLEPGDPQGDPGDYVMFTVADTGTGIPPEVMDKIFEPFFTTKEQGKGTGLGLSMVFGFVQQSGGHIRLYSEPGKGTTFRLYFPRCMTKNGKSAAPVAAPRQPALIHQPRQGPVLIVEDQDAIRALAVSIFERMGYSTIACQDAHEGLKALKDHPTVSLLFSDIMLPGGMTGDALAEQALRMRPDLPILLTSGFAEQTIDLAALMECGVLFQEKPYQLSDIQQKVNQLFAHVRGQLPPDQRESARRN